MAYTTIDKPTDYFETKLHTGNGGTQSITGLDFKPDWVWIKDRSRADNNTIFDVVRGVQKYIFSDTTNAEQTDSNTLTSFNANGFSIGSGSLVNYNSDTYVSWNWKAGTSFTNDASATGIGTIDSTGSVNTDAGFSIISYTGNGTANQSVAHGLGATPKFIIIKPRSASGYWCVTNPRFVSVSDPNVMYLQITQGESGDTNINGTTAPSSTVFGVDDYGAVNTNNQTQIAYCMTPIKGYSAMSTYTGNGSADGTFVYTGFKPAWVMCKIASGGSDNWNIVDNKRAPFNEAENTIRANLNNAEYTGTAYGIDILSNGFKCRTTDGNFNGSGSIYIYMAFAENPFVSSTGIPAMAR